MSKVDFHTFTRVPAKPAWLIEKPRTYLLTGQAGFAGTRVAVLKW